MHLLCYYLSVFSAGNWVEIFWILLAPPVPLNLRHCILLETPLNALILFPKLLGWLGSSLGWLAHGVIGLTDAIRYRIWRSLARVYRALVLGWLDSSRSRMSRSLKSEIEYALNFEDWACICSAITYLYSVPAIGLEFSEYYWHRLCL